LELWCLHIRQIKHNENNHDLNDEQQYDNHGSVLHGLVFVLWRWLAGSVQSMVLRLLRTMSLRHIDSDDHNEHDNIVDLNHHNWAVQLTHLLYYVRRVEGSLR
jgi:hypothetical protein